MPYQVPAAAISAALVALGLCGCAPPMGGAGSLGSSGYAAGSRNVINDLQLKTDIGNALARVSPPLQAEVAATVYGGRALLTGRAQSPQAKEQIRQIAGQVPGVRQVYDEVEVGLPPTAGSLARDAWISAQLRSQLVFEPNLRALNFAIETADQSVYLLGTATSQAELDRATQLARYVSDVRRVVSYVELRPGSPLAAQSPPTPAPPAGVRSPDSPAAAPSIPVEVHRL